MLCSFFGWSQTLREVLRVDGRVKGMNGKLENVRVALLYDGDVVQEQRTKSNGRFAFKIPLQKDYMMVFSKEGYRSKYVDIIASNIPEADAAYGYEFGGFEVPLFKNTQGINDEVLDKPVAEIIYDLEQYKFVFNRKHFEQIADAKEELEKELKELSENQKKLEEKQALALAKEQEEIRALEQEKLKAVERMRQKNMQPTSNPEVIALNTSLNNKKQLDELAQKAKEIKEEPYLNTVEKPKETPIEKRVVKPVPEPKQEPKKINPPKPKKVIVQKPVSNPEPVTKEPANPPKKEESKANQKPEKRIYRKGNKTITEIKAYLPEGLVIYKKVVADWGGTYFFKDNVSLTVIDFEKEIEKIGLEL